MAKPRKRHVQQELFRHGGRRKGAGRKPKGKRAGSPHKARPEIKARHPIHIVLRVHDDLGGLRKRHMYHALRDATITVAARELHDKEMGAFRIVHASIQGTHIHLLVEADNKDALANGMQRFQISAAKLLNRAVSIERELPRRRRGKVFTDRYHMEVITTPRQARHALAYVLNNWRKHREDTGLSWKVDPYSTGMMFTGWREREGADLMMRYREPYKPLVVYLPKTWLLQTGWRLGGGSIPFDYVPSSPVPAPVRSRAAARPKTRRARTTRKSASRTNASQSSLW